MAMLNDAERPLIIAGGGVINADASGSWSSSPRSPRYP
jgi:glyoxylate carboligase